jgi:hypothetical protein
MSPASRASSRLRCARGRRWHHRCKRFAWTCPTRWKRCCSPSTSSIVKNQWPCRSISSLRPTRFGCEMSARARNSPLGLGHGKRRDQRPKVKALPKLAATR